MDLVRLRWEKVDKPVVLVSGHGRVGLGCREKSLVFVRVGNKNSKLPLLKDLTLQYDV